MQETINPRPLWVNKPPILEKVVKQLDNFSSLSVDTESNSLYVYREQVCLIQISTTEFDYLIDPLALTDLSPLAPLFSDPKREKIFHASEYDVICLKRDFGFEFANIFDTMIAARILGKEAIGLASLLNSYLEIELEKKFQRANWGMRPLPEAMLEYACQDSRYLLQLRNALEKELHQKNLLELALEDFRMACNVPAHSPNPQKKSSWQVAGSNNISPQEAAVLNELCDFRENEAVRLNLPPFKIISNEVLVKLSRIQPAVQEEMKDIKGLNDRLIRRYGPSILKAVEVGKNAPPLKKPRKARPDERFLKRFDALREWRKNKGREINVESDIILPKDFVERIAAIDPKTDLELVRIMKDSPYRYKHFHKEILQALHKQEIS